MRLFDLFRPAWNSKNPERRMKAVSAIKGEGNARGIRKLLKIAELTSYEDTRQQALMRLAMESRNEELGLPAVRKITDEEILAKVAMKGGGEDIRLEALKKIFNPQLLATIALSNNYSTVIIAAMERITDQDILARVAFEIGWDSDRLAAMEFLTDQKHLEKVAFTDANTVVRSAAIAKLTDKEIARQALQQIFDGTNKSDKSYRLCQLLDSAVEMAKIYPEVIAQNWSKILDVASKQHVDKGAHSNDCHNDFSEHKDGYGRKYFDRFPPYVKKQ